MEPTWKFVIHVLVGALQFLLILPVALALAGVVYLIRGVSFVSPWLVYGIERVEQVVFWADVFAFGLFLLAEMLKLAADLWRQVKEAWQE